MTEGFPEPQLHHPPIYLSASRGLGHDLDLHPNETRVPKPPTHDHGNSSVDGLLDVDPQVSRLSQDIVTAMIFFRDSQSIWPETLLACIVTLGLVSSDGRVTTTTTYTDMFKIILSVLWYRLTLHPLARFPGSFHARVADVPDIYRTSTGDRHLDQLEDHNKYGAYRADATPTFTSQADA
jgi:hypothetical protein